MTRVQRDETQLSQKELFSFSKEPHKLQMPTFQLGSKISFMEIMLQEHCN